MGRIIIEAFAYYHTKRVAVRGLGDFNEGGLGGGGVPRGPNSERATFIPDTGAK